MATLFTRIIDGELPGRFVWRDECCVAFLSINPLKPGHTLVVPRAEIDHWLDLDKATRDHLMDVATQIGAALQQAYNPPKVALIIAGLEVPHLHLHLVPIWGEQDLNFARAERDPDPAALDQAATTLRTALEELGAAEVAH